MRTSKTITVACLLAACDAPPTEWSPEGTSAQDPGGILERVKQEATACLRVTNDDYAFVGGTFDALSGTHESYPFELGPFNTCASPLTNTLVSSQSILRSKYDLERAFSSAVTVSGSAGYGPVSISGNAKSEVEERIKISHETINFLFKETVIKKTVFLGDAVPFSQTFRDTLAAPDGQRRVHDGYGDLYTKTAFLGHSMSILFVADLRHSEKYRREDFEMALEAKYKNASTNAALKTTKHTTSQVSEMLSLMKVSVFQLVSSGTSPLPVVTELSFDGVKAAIAAFRANANNNTSYGLVAAELESLDQRFPYTRGQLFDWRAYGTAVADYSAMAGELDKIGGLVTEYQQLPFRASRLAAGIRRLIGMYQDLSVLSVPNTPGPNWFTDMIGGIWREHSAVSSIHNEYRALVDASSRIKAGRQTDICLGLGGNGPGGAGLQTVAEPCNGRDDQLFRYIGRQLRSISGHCLDVEGGGARGTVLLSACAAPATTAQTWTFSSGSRKIDPWRTRTINFLSTGHPDSLLRATNGTLGSATSWSRSHYEQYDWQLRK